MDVWTLKESNGVLYAGGGGSQGKIFSSTDGHDWTPLGRQDSIPDRVGGFFMWNDIPYIATSPGIVLRLEGNEWVRAYERSIGYPTDLAVLNSRLVCSFRDFLFPLGISTDGDTLAIVGDSLNRYCVRRPLGVDQSWIGKLLPGNYNGQTILYCSAMLAYKFVYRFDGNSLACLGTQGLNEEEAYYGVHDLIWKGDTLLAGATAAVKMFLNGAWSTYGDTLPPTPTGFSPYATALAVWNGKLFVGTNYIGVIQWVPGNGWVSIAEGLPKFPDGFYDSIALLSVIQNRLIVAYGTSKTWRSTSTGLYSIDLINVAR
jgi:hypothetical protein